MHGAAKCHDDRMGGWREGGRESCEWGQVAHQSANSDTGLTGTPPPPPPIRWPCPSFNLDCAIQTHPPTHPHTNTHKHSHTHTHTHRHTYTHTHTHRRYQQFHQPTPPCVAQNRTHRTCNNDCEATPIRNSICLTSFCKFTKAVLMRRKGEVSVIL